MARPTVRDFAPWRRQPLTIPPNTLRTWLALAVWELWMGVLLCGALAVRHSSHRHRAEQHRHRV